MRGEWGPIHLVAITVLGVREENTDVVGLIMTV